LRIAIAYAIIELWQTATEETKMTITELKTLTNDLTARDFGGFARAVSAIDPALGRTVAMHAVAADGNSPDLSGWLQCTLDDAASLDTGGITTADAAEAWWMAKYVEVDECE
jgi:hypothetical protein